MNVNCAPRRASTKMQTFNFLSVATIEDAVAALSKGVSRPLAGGTDLIPMLREGRRTADAVVDVKRIPELMSLEIGAQGVLTIGASVSCQRISRDPEIARRWPGLIDGISLIGGTQIQGRASLGGNLCTASPAGDAIPALIVHGATLVIAGPGGRREMAAADFLLGPGRNALAPGELLVAVRVPAPVPGFCAAYLRFIPRNEMDIAVASAGISMRLDEGGRITDLRLALGAVGPTPIVVADAAAIAAGQVPSADLAARLGAAAEAAARPIDDVRGTAVQRRRLVNVLTRRAFDKAIQRLA